MSKLTLKPGTEAEFFRRGRKIAQLADQNKPIPAERMITFEDPDDLLKRLTAPSSEPKF